MTQSELTHSEDVRVLHTFLISQYSPKTLNRILSLLMEREYVCYVKFKGIDSMSMYDSCTLYDNLYSVCSEVEYVYLCEYEKGHEEKQPFFPKNEDHPYSTTEDVLREENVPHIKFYVRDLTYDFINTLNPYISEVYTKLEGENDLYKISLDDLLSAYEYSDYGDCEYIFICLYFNKEKEEDQPVSKKLKDDPIFMDADYLPLSQLIEQHEDVYTIIEPGHATEAELMHISEISSQDLYMKVERNQKVYAVLCTKSSPFFVDLNATHYLVKNRNNAPVEKFYCGYDAIAGADTCKEQCETCKVIDDKVKKQSIEKAFASEVKLPVQGWIAKGANPFYCNAEATGTLSDRCSEECPACEEYRKTDEVNEKKEAYITGKAYVTPSGVTPKKTSEPMYSIDPTLEKKEKTIYDLELHETLNVDTYKYYTRVPGGWIHTDTTSNRINTFVPFDNEFMDNSKGCGLCGK